jgi:hypothetical protein
MEKRTQVVLTDKQMHRVTDFGDMFFKNLKQTNLDQFLALFGKKEKHSRNAQAFSATKEKYIFLYFFEIAEKASLIIQFLKRILNCRIIVSSTKNHTMTEAFLSIDTNKFFAVELKLTDNAVTDTCNVTSSLDQVEMSEKDDEADATQIRSQINSISEPMHIDSEISCQKIITWLESFFASMNVNVGVEELDMYLDYCFVSCIDRILSGQDLTTNIFTKRNLDFWLLLRQLRENIQRHAMVQELTNLSFTPENFVELHNSNIRLSHSLRSNNLQERTQRHGNLEVARFLSYMNVNGELDNFTTSRLLSQLNVSAVELVHPRLTSLNLHPAYPSRAQ